MSLLLFNWCCVTGMVSCWINISIYPRSASWWIVYDRVLWLFSYKIPLLQTCIILVTNGDSKDVVAIYTSNYDRRRRTFMFNLLKFEVFFASVCVCLGERGRGWESSGTGWENPPLPPGGTPSPLTSPTSPSSTILWGTSVTLSPASAMYVNPSVGKKHQFGIFSSQIGLAPPEMWSHGHWVVLFCLGVCWNIRPPHPLCTKESLLHFFVSFTTEQLPVSC